MNNDSNNDSTVGDTISAMRCDSEVESMDDPKAKLVSAVEIDRAKRSGDRAPTVPRHPSVNRLRCRGFIGDLRLAATRYKRVKVWFPRLGSPSK